MVYSEKIEQNGNIAIYAMGALYNDLTGLLKIDFNDNSFEIVKQPQKAPVHEHFVNKMMAKYREYIYNGETPDEMSYEI